MKVLIGVILVLFMVGCGQGSTSGGLDRGDGAAVKAKTPPKKSSVTPSSTQSKGRSLALRHTPHPGRAVRWASRNIQINVSDVWAVKGANVWRPLGFRFTHGMEGGIVFGGYSKARNSVGWSRFSFSRGRITKCTIYINPKWLRRYDIAETFAHEAGHCLGINGHIEGGLMGTYGGNGMVSQNTRAMLTYLYSIKQGGKL